MNEKDTRNSLPLTDDDLTGVTGGEFATVSTDGLVKYVASKESTADYLMKEIIPDPPIPDPPPDVDGNYCARCSKRKSAPMLKWVEGYGKLCPNCRKEVCADDQERWRYHH